MVPAETQCIKIYPAGSEVRFRLIPRDSGSFEVSANVFLFNSADCSGAPIPRTATSLSVTVDVDFWKWLRNKAGELGQVFWTALLKFWAELLALFFALLLFLIRDRLKQWFGFRGKGT